MNIFSTLVLFCAIYGANATPIKRAVINDISSLSEDLSRGSMTRQQEIFNRIMELASSLETEPESWPLFLSRAVSNDVPGVTAQSASRALRGRRWNTQGSAWDNFSAGQGIFGDLISKAKSNVAEKVASIVAGMDRFFKKLSSKKKSSGEQESTTTMTSIETTMPQERTKSVSLIETTIPIEQEQKKEQEKQATPRIGEITTSITSIETTMPQERTKSVSLIETTIPIEQEQKKEQENEASPRIGKTSSDSFKSYDTPPNAVGASANIANANAEAFMAESSVTAAGASTNIANANAEAFKATASASVTGASLNIGNVNAQALSASANVHAGALQTNVGNVNVSPLSVSGSAGLTPSVNAFNVDVSPGSFSLSLNPASFSFGCISVGGLSLSLPQLTDLFNLGLGGSGGGASSGGSRKSGGSSNSGGRGNGSNNSGGNGNGNHGSSRIGGNNGNSGTSSGSNNSAGNGNGNHGSSRIGGNNGNSGASNGGGGRWSQKKADILKRLPNIHYDEEGNKYVNGVKVLKLKSSRHYMRVVDPATLEGVPWSSTGPDPFGVPQNQDEVNEMLNHHKDAYTKKPLSQGDAHKTSCHQSTLICESHVHNIHQVNGINHENVVRAVSDLLSTPNAAVAMHLQGSGDHIFVVTGHGDNVVVTNSWQNYHTMRNEPPMERSQFFGLLETILNPRATSAERQSAARTLFNHHDIDTFGTIPVSIQSTFSGTIDSPIFARENSQFGAPGLIPQPARQSLVAGPREFESPSFLNQAIQNRASSSNSASSNSLTTEEENEVQKLVTQYVQEHYGKMDEHNVRAAMEYASSDIGLQETERAHETEEPVELCDYCRARGRVSCFRCLVNRGGRKIVRHGNSNVHGFGN